MTQPTQEEKDQAEQALKRLLTAAGMDPGEAADLADFTIGKAAEGSTSA